jgi:hypothetical protein
MSDQAGNQIRKIESGPYATREDFINVFREGMSGFYRLSFLLTGDHEKAKRCLVAGVEDCVKENRVFREWARSWAKRIIVQNAIRELKPRPNLRRSSPVATVFPQNPASSGYDEHFDVDALLALEDFERFVFVMTVLENYSHYECALLLGCSVFEIREGRVHALEELASRGQAVFFAS